MLFWIKLAKTTGPRSKHPPAIQTAKPEKEQEKKKRKNKEKEIPEAPRGIAVQQRQKQSKSKMKHRAAGKNMEGAEAYMAVKVNQGRSCARSCADVLDVDPASCRLMCRFVWLDGQPSRSRLADCKHG